MALLESVKLPDILKASAPQALAVALACGLFLYLGKQGVLPRLDPWMVLLAAFVGILAALLFVVLTVARLWKWADLAGYVRQWRLRRARRKAVADYIPHMTQKEREIIGCLLERNHKSFDCDVDGGYAAPLIARGIVVNALRPGQVFDFHRVPMIIPDDVWSVLKANQQAFPKKYTGELDPWRIHWMAQ